MSGDGGITASVSKSNLPSVTGLNPRLVSNLAQHSTFILQPSHLQEREERNFSSWIHQDLNQGPLTH